MSRALSGQDLLWARTGSVWYLCARLYGIVSPLVGNKPTLPAMHEQCRSTALAPCACPWSRSSSGRACFLPNVLCMLATPTHSFVVHVGYRSDQMFAYIGSSYATTKYQHLGLLTVSYATTQCDVPASTHRGEETRRSTNGK